MAGHFHDTGFLSSPNKHYQKKRDDNILQKATKSKETPMQEAFLYKVIGYQPLSCDNVSLWELCRILKIL